MTHFFIWDVARASRPRSSFRRRGRGEEVETCSADPAPRGQRHEGRERDMAVNIERYYPGTVLMSR